MEETDNKDLIKSSAKESVVFVMQRVIITPSNSEQRQSNRL